MKAKQGTETRRATKSELQTCLRQQSRGEGQEASWLARAVGPFHHTSTYSYAECFTVSLRMKLFKQISTENVITNIIEEGTNYRQKQLGRALGQASQRQWQLSWVLKER